MGVDSSILGCFYFASLSGVNPGVISTIFTTSLIFTAVVFHFGFNQKLTLRDYLGGALIIGSLLMIAFGQEQADPKAESDA